MKPTNTLILGIGNTLLSDEGVGVHALNLLQSSHPDLPDLTYIDGGTLSFTLAAYIEDCDQLIVFDAARRSPHEVGLLDLFDIARLTESLPLNRALIGIQPQSIEWGMSPTPVVAKSLSIAVEQALVLLEQWGRAERSTAKSVFERFDYPSGPF